MSKVIPTAAVTLAANQRKKEKAYWLHRLAGHPVKDSFPVDHETADPVPSYRLETAGFSMPEEISRPLIELSKESSERMFIILMTGIFILLRKYAGVKDIIVGIPVSQPVANRDFINYALPVRLRVEDDNTFRQLLSKMRETLIEATANQNFPCEVLPGLLDLPWPDGEGFPLFDVSVSLKNIHRHTLQELAPNMMVSFEYAANKITGLFSYNAVCYRPDTIERLSGHYLELLAGALANPDKKISTLELLTEQEKEQILVTFNDTAGDFPGGVTVDELIDRQAEQTPGAIAVVYKEQRLSYAELKVRTGCLAVELKQRGLGPDQIAAVISGHTPEMIVILVGILKSGAAYLPIDPTYPQERIDYILNDSGASIVINEKFFRESVPAGAILQKSPTGNANLAYIIYTSGSTGKPKGVMIDHRAFIDFTTWAVVEFEHRPGYQVLLSNSYASDGAIQQIFPPLISGGTLHLIDKELRLDVVHYLVYLKTHKINNIDEVPILMKELVAQFDPNDREEKLPDLTCLSLGSEHVPIELVKKCRQHLNHRGRIINAYGPAEASVETTTYHCDGTTESEQSLIGKPRRNTRVYILDETGHLCPIGVRGEICISGVGLARGYLNRPELTAERFNRSYKSYKTYILYKTGDRGCWLADGNIRFFGRIDDQIKIRGYRVELQEIEIVLKSYNSIKDAIVLTRENTTGESEICAYYVSETGTLNKPSLREYIEKRLPSYMIPAHLLELEKIPLTPNGKVDKNALPGPVADSTGEYLPPRTEIEKKLVEIWENVLGVKKIGINDNFFAVGGDSIKTIQIASRLNTAGYRLQMKDIFNYPTISQLASLVKLEQSTAEQSEVTGTIPLTPVQRWFFEEPFPAPHHFNQAVMFYAPEGFDKQILINVFTRIQEHHDILRATYRKNPYNKEIIQIIDGGDYPLSFREYDLKNQENSLTEFNHKINEIQAGIELENGPLMKLGLFHLDDGDRLLIVIHHLAIDGVSWRILFEDIETLYSQYKRGEKPVLPPKTGSFKQWSEKLSLYADSKTFLKEKIYWAQLEEKSVPEIKKDFEIEANIEKDIQGLSFTLDQEETNLLLTKVNRAYKTEINDILLTALGLGIKKTFSHDRLLVALEGHGREEILEGIDINRTVGWFTSVYPVMLDMCHMGDPGRQIKEIKETLRRIPNKGMGYGILKYLTAAEHKKEIEFKLKPQISFNYLGQFDADVKKISFFQIAKESPGHSQSLNNRREYLFDVGGMIANKRLTMTISYNQTHFKPETVAALSNHFEAELKSLIAFCSTREKTRPTPADFTYKGLSIETIDRLIKEYPGLEDIYTLTPMQEGMLFHALIDEKSSSYFEQTSYRLEGELNIVLVEKSLNELFKRHDILRTAFVHKESERRVQVVLCDRTVDFYYEDISKIEEKENFVHEFKIQDKARSFDLSKETLMRVGILKLGNSEYEFTWSFHHILMDGWCVGIINSEFFEIYNSYLENRPYRLPQLKPYRTYIEWLEKQDKEKSAEYWKNYLYSYEEQVGVPKTVVMKTQASEPAYKNEQVVIILDREKTAHLEKLAAINHVTLNIATQVIWGILLGKYNGKEDVVFGAVVSGRPFQLESVESILGLFINTVPVRIKFTEIMEFRALLQKVQEEALAAEPFHYSPLAEIQAGSVLKQNLIDHLFIFENYPIADQIEGYGDNGNKKNGLKLKLTHIDVFEQTNYDFNIILAGVEKLRIVLRYNGHVYDNNYVKKIAEHLNLIIDHVIANPSTPVVDIEIISEATKKELLNYFNENLHEALAIMPIQSHLANAFLKYSANTACEYGTIHLTYARLEYRAGCISQWLRNHNIPVGSFIGIYIEAKTDIIAAIIGILQRGCIFVPLDTALPEKRIESMIRLTNMKVILTDTAHEIKLTGMKEDIDIFIIDESFYYSHEPERNNIEEIKYDPEDKIYVYFSSGSTGQPNAVLGRNKSLVQFLQWEIETFAVTENDRISQLTAVGFDAFLRDVFVPLLAGGTACIPGSKEILLEAGTFITWLDSNHISLVHCVPSLFRIIDTKQLTPSSFSRLKYVLLSGEPINPTELQDWYRVLGPRIQLVNYYGPTETTMIKTFHPITMNDIENGKIPAGRPIRGSRIIILDKHMKICDRGITGEIYIRTAYGTYGYLHNPALNAQRFIKNPFSEGEGDLIYKTGDLGRQLENGEIEVLGRIDRQVKIRGVRIELENIENCLLKHDKIERAIVISRKSETGENFLCAYIIYKKEENQTVPAASELREHLSKELPDYMIPLYFVPIEKIPLTPNGKIDIKALPAHEIKSDGGFIAPRNAMEEKLAELWEEILGIKKESISIDANFFDLGGHSLTTTTLLSRIHRDLDVRIPLAEMFKTPNIKGLSAYIKSLETETGQLPEDKYAAIEPVEEKEYYPLSSAQKRLYFLQELDLQGIGYNMPLVLPLGNEIEKDRLERVLKQLIDRHESLRTSFQWVKEEVVQRIHKNVEFKLEYYDLAAGETGEEKRRVESFIRPFDLSKAPLIRSGLIRHPDGNYTWLIDVHHIVSDGTSHTILTREFMRLYKGDTPLAPLQTRYKDFAQWQNCLFASGEIKAQEKYWLELYSGEIPSLDLPIDYKRPAVFTFAGAAHPFTLTGTEVGSFKALCRQGGGTLYMNMLAALNTLFYKYTGQEDIIIGSGIAGRRHDNLQGIVGVFINTLAMRNYPYGEMPYDIFLKEVVANSVKAFENQDVQFEDLVEKLTVARDLSRNPVFDVMLMGDNYVRAGRVEILHAESLPTDYAGSTSKFDMTLFVVESNEDIYIDIQYYRAIFKHETIQRMASHLKTLVKTVGQNPGIPLKDIEIISDEEKQQLLVEFNDTAAAYPDDKTIHQLFAEQVEKAPDAIALVQPVQSVGLVRPGSLSYRALNEQSGRMAGLFIEKGVLADNIVGIMMERSLEMIIVIMGILKSGGAYLPIDPEYPRERIDYMLKDSAAKILVTENEIVSLSKECGFNYHHSSYSSYSSYSLSPVHHSNQLAYLIYTSGSTGRPKGVAVEHRNVINFIQGITAVIDFLPGKTILALTTICFDIFLLETLLPLVKGLSVIIASRDQQRDPYKLAGTIVKSKINMLQITPSRLKLLMDCDNNLICLKKTGTLMIGGENLPVHLFDTLKTRYQEKIYNLYGPTETTVWSTVKDLTNMENITIGVPLGNTRIYILDSYSNIRPIGAAGELFIAGNGLSRGYLNNAELTAEKFGPQVTVITQINKIQKTKINKSFGKSRNPFSKGFLAVGDILYKTGDLARWLADGNIEFLGRIDHQVKIRGFRIELGEIENRLLTHPEVKAAIVTAGEDNSGDKFLCAYIIVKKEETTSGAPLDFSEYLAQRLPDYMIPAYFVQLDRIPLTPNGKVDKKALPEPGFNSNSTGYIPPGNDMETKLTEIWSEVLGIEKEKIGVHDNFFQSGGNSLKIVALTAKIYKEFNVKIPLPEAFKNKTIRTLSKYMMQSGKNKYLVIEPLEKKDYYDVSFGQKRVWLLSQSREASLTFNMHSTYLLKAEVDMGLLNKAFNALIERHENLRTVFLVADEEVKQKILPAGELHFQVDYQDFENVTDKETQIRALVSAEEDISFDLGNGPLIRVKLIRITEKEYLLLCNMHHIISDFLSMEILQKEFLQIYEALKKEETNPLKPLKFQYKDFACWQNKQLQGHYLEKLRDYWGRQFNDQIPILQLPYDKKRPRVQSYNGETAVFSISGITTAKLRTTAEENDVTLFMVLLASVNIFLSFYSGQNDIIIGTPVSGREHPDLENQIGFYLNTLALRTQFKEEETFTQLLAAIKKVALGAFEHQIYPFDKLIDELKIKRESGRHPLFDVMVDMINLTQTPHPHHHPQESLNHAQAQVEQAENDETLEFLETSKPRAKFDLVIYFYEKLKNINVAFEYNTDLFERQTIVRMVNRYRGLLSDIVKNPLTAVSKLLLEEKVQLPSFGSFINK